MSHSGAWHRRGEVGSLLGIRITAWVYRRIGRGLAGLLLYPIVGYFFVTGRGSRVASQHYLQRLQTSCNGDIALPESIGRMQVFRHMLEFGTNILDRIGFFMGRRGDFELSVHGGQWLDKVAVDGRGAVVLGAHLGSFDALRLLASELSPVTVNVLMYTNNAEHINRVFAELSERETVRGRVIPIQRGSFAHVIEARACVGRGEVVAILADRQPPGHSERTTPVRFLGGTAWLPQGAWLLAGLLRCPVLLMIALRRRKRCYEIYVEPVADPLDLPRQGRSGRCFRLG